MDPRVAERLERAEKILFVYQLALGDFVYLQHFMRAFAERYPRAKIHLWIDDTRRSWRFWRWPRQRQDALYQWLRETPFVAKIYEQAYSLGEARRALRDARRERYPIVVSMCTVRPWYFAGFTRVLGPAALRAGMHRPSKNFGGPKSLGFRALHVKIPVTRRPGDHISDMYAERFESLFDVRVEKKDRLPRLEIPERWMSAAKGPTPFVFVNAFSRKPIRSWTLERVAELITGVREKHPELAFVVNAPPEKHAETTAFFEARKLDRVVPFSARNNFFELPAMMKLASLIVSVDTSTMHFASAVGVPLVGLMRHDNPEWAPLDLATGVVIKPAAREGLVSDIPASEVVAAVLAQRAGSTPRASSSATSASGTSSSSVGSP